MKRLLLAIAFCLAFTLPSHAFLSGTDPPLGATFTGSIVLSDDDSIGLGAAKGRIVFNDTTADEIHILDALLQVGTASGAGNVNITPASAIVGLAIDMVANDAAGITINTEAPNQYGIDINGKRAAIFKTDASGGIGLDVRRLIDEAGSLPLVRFLDTAGTASTQTTLLLDHDGTGGASAHSIDIDHENTAAAAVKIDQTAGAPVWELIATSDTPDADPETHAQDGWIEIDVGGTAYYLPFYRLTQ